MDNREAAERGALSLPPPSIIARRQIEDTAECNGEIDKGEEEMNGEPDRDRERAKEKRERVRGRERERRSRREREREIKRGRGSGRERG